MVRHRVDRARRAITILGGLVLAPESVAGIDRLLMGSVVVMRLKAVPCSVGKASGLQPCQKEGEQERPQKWKPPQHCYPVTSPIFPGKRISDPKAA